MLSNDPRAKAVMWNDKWAMLHKLRCESGFPKPSSEPHKEAPPKLVNVTAAKTNSSAVLRKAQQEGSLSLQKSEHASMRVRQAKGPDGTRGFANRYACGRGRSLGYANTLTGVLPEAKPKSVILEEISPSSEQMNKCSELSQFSRFDSPDEDEEEEAPDVDDMYWKRK